MFKDYSAKALTAKVMSQSTISDGTQAYEILNFDIDKEGFLDFNFKIMPFIPDEWNETINPFENHQPTPFAGVIGFAQGLFDGGVRPELVFLTKSGVFRYTPWNRTNGSGGTRGLEEIKNVTWDGSFSVTPEGSPLFPPQTLTIGNRIYFNWGDGGPMWAWNGVKLRKFGFQEIPDAPRVLSPQGVSSGNDSTGFNVRGDIGTIVSNMLNDGSDAVSSHGLLNGEWFYRVIFENEDGAYSTSSAPSNFAAISSSHTATSSDAVAYRRAFYVTDIPTGPAGTVARVLVRTPDTQSANLNKGDQRYRFLTRIPNNCAIDYLDNIADAGLGEPWDERENAPTGTYLLQNFSNSLFLMRTRAYPYRLWWSEQTSLFGSTPESFIKNHYLDVNPASGGITGSQPVRSGAGDTTTPTMLVFQKTAASFVSGSYPEFTVGSLHQSAGLAGPSLVQTAADNKVVWYGNGTFWMFDPANGQISDIGRPIRLLLSRVNLKRAGLGVSWRGTLAGELVFVLPMDDSREPNREFIWDHVSKGWRTKDVLTIKAAIVIEESDITLISGSRAVNEDFVNTVPVSYPNIQNGVYAYGNSHPGFNFSEPKAIYKSGWTSMGELGPTMHALSNVNDLVVILKETFSGTIDVSSYQDWDSDNNIESGNLTAAHPENDNIPYYGSSVYGSSVYRSSRTYSDRTPLNIASASVFQVKLESSNPMKLLTMDVYGPMVALPGGRTAQ